MATKCQLDVLTYEVGRQVPRRARLARLGRRATEIFWKLLSPSAVARKVRKVLHLSKPPAKAAASKFPPLGLKAGERVRVKSLEEIQLTLEPDGSYERCYFVVSSMAEYCDKTYTVVKRVDRFYDERNRRMVKARNMVLLEGVHCRGMPIANHEEDWAGCDRMCFLFWKEAWLERV